MKPRQLEAFRAVMTMGGITAGADHLRLSQPAVTRLIRDLERSALEIAEWIADGAYDLGFATTAATHSSVRIHMLPPVRAVAVLAPDHRLAKQAVVRPADLAGEL